MASTFTLSLQLDFEAWEGMEAECETEAHAIQDARKALEAVIELRSALGDPPSHAAARVAFGSLAKQPDEMVWLGEWGWTAGEGWHWRTGH